MPFKRGNKVTGNIVVVGLVILDFEYKRIRSRVRVLTCSATAFALFQYFSSILSHVTCYLVTSLKMHLIYKLAQKTFLRTHLFQFAQPFQNQRDNYVEVADRQRTCL